MAPTEILASQHLRTLSSWCEKAGLRIRMLSASTRRAERASMMALLAAGQIDILVGTHALLVDDVTFYKLGLVVVDEQHRFGVEQRAKLREKDEVAHLLAMTATPIPRSLALTAYGELELSVMLGKPPGRTPPVTKLMAGKAALAKARERVVKAVKQGISAFVVCPLVEASESIDVTDVEATAAAFRELLVDHKIELVHGRLSAAQKEEAMQRFRSGESAVLVATTVIEVGVDVSQARFILIEHAERFGLAQLHQLRGRVGRGGETSTCILHTGFGPSSESARRLAILEQSSDGFDVAQADLELRGPGEVFGTKQSGLPKLRFATYGREGLEILVKARKAAGKVLQRDPKLAEHPRMLAELERRIAAGLILARDGG